MFKTVIRIIKVSFKFKGLFFIVTFLTSIVTLINVLIPQTVRLVFDLIATYIKTGNQNLNLFWIYFIAYGSLYVLRNILDSGGEYYLDKWWLRTRNYLYNLSFRHLETLSLDYFEANSSGRLREKISRGVESIVVIMEDLFIDIFQQFMFIFIAGYFLYRINFYFGLVLSIAAPLYVAIVIIFSSKLNYYQKEHRRYEEEASGVAIDTIANIKTVKSYGNEELQLEKLDRFLARSFDYSITRSKLLSIIRITRENLINLAKLIIFGLGSYWALKGNISLGVFYLAWSYTERSLDPLRRVMRSYDTIQREFVAVQRLFELIDTKPNLTDVQNAGILRNVQGNIEFEHLTFSYKEENIIKNLNLNIEKGKVLALVGKSGVGKSTLIKLLLRLYDPKEGVIKIDGKDIRNFTQNSLRNNISVVFQDSALFNDTVANNILFGKPNAKKNEIIEAAKKANAHEFIMMLPKGYDTIVGERGVKLSGGEQQRINIARAFLKNAPILVLDEATSSLDSENEALIQDALWKLIDGKTTIIIAHRLSTVMRADSIVVIDKGKIVEKDSHDQLVKNDGIYSKLFAIQSGGYLK